MPIERAPATLIDEEGRPRAGIYDAPIEKLNHLDFVPPGGRRRVSPNRIKRWEYLGVASDEWIVGGAVVSLNFLGNAFFYVFDRKRRRLAEFGTLAPLARGIRIESNGGRGTVSFERGRNRLVIENDRAAGRHRCEARFGRVRLDVEVEDRKPPLVCVTRVGFAGFNYTMKLAGLPARGTIDLAGERHALEPSSAFGVIDFTTGCLARQTFWNWASGGGRDEKGNEIGLNLVLGVNESGLTENAFWVGDDLVKVDTVRFDYDDRRILEPWRIRSWDGRVDLTFQPEGERREAIDLGLIASRFHQPFGSFSGRLVDAAGKVHRVAGLPGYVEEHFARW